MSDKAAPQPLNLLEYHRPKRIRLSDPRIPPLTAESKRCLRNLAAYRPRKALYPYPRTRSAAVIVALFVGRMGDLYVLLNRRSATLRSYAGDTSLPGGKVDPDDKSLEETARREAFEEIGLPRDRLKVPLLCILEPFMASNKLIVTPVVVLILDPIVPILNTAEVTSLFSHPLSAFMSSSPPFPTESELVEVPYHSVNDFVSVDALGRERPARVHRFLTGREAGGIKPIFGMTSAVLIEAACIAHAPRVPDYEVYPPGVDPRDKRIAIEVFGNPIFRKAYEEEGVSVDWAVVRRVAGVRGRRKDGRRDRDGSEGEAEADTEVSEGQEHGRRRRRRMGGRVWSKL
ncbi:NUDIX hydrolase domain-like protein [Roridomyces roridus]|uniref:NUDIX hydrolase domain-like protein n=1 Tax=Roridomyces roridus TaxID=1738132 RepID=A0AAD7B9Y9_9AGAR|nr:NUDIX hydrolase domain-like protein [Roridomyces roridus]